MRPPQGFEWLLILLVVLLLFGGKRLPDMARGLGRSLRIFKAETKALGEDDSGDSDPTGNPDDQASAPTDQPAERAHGDKPTT